MTGSAGVALSMAWECYAGVRGSSNYQSVLVHNSPLLRAENSVAGRGANGGRLGRDCDAITKRNGLTGNRGHAFTRHDHANKIEWIGGGKSNGLARRLGIAGCFIAQCA